MVERVVSVNYFGRLKLHGKGSLKSQMWMTLAQTTVSVLRTFLHDSVLNDRPALLAETALENAQMGSSSK